jgi:hypothetical protein
MISDSAHAAARRSRWPPRIALAALLGVAIAAMSMVMHVVARHTIEIVRARHLLPRWDLATHLGHGWEDYHLLVTGRIPALLWDLWLQGYWPPGLSLFQMPFYLVLGGDMTSGLWSGPAAFVLVGVLGCLVLWRQLRDAAFLPAALFLALLMSSPFLLASASVTMTETLGAAAQVFVVLAYVSYRQDPTAGHARLVAIALTVLFFVKYNYFVLLVGPLVLFEWLDRTSGWSPARRVTSVWRWVRGVLSSPTGACLAAYVVLLLIVLMSGGFEVRIFGSRVSVRGIGNSGTIVLYILLLRVWYLHRRGRLEISRWTSADPLVRPLLIWFVVPVTIWLASPYPNHLRDVANLVINRPVGEPTVGSGISTYVTALRTVYFQADWILVAVLIVFAVAALRYRQQSAGMQWLVLTIPLQFAAIALHQTRFPRFLLLTVVLLCLAASSEVGRWIARASGGARLVAGVLAPIVVVCGVTAGRRVVAEDRFRIHAFEHYTDSDTLRTALQSIRRELTADDRLVIVGESNDLSPGLFRWELGPPSGVPCFPFQLGGVERLDLTLATRVLLIEPIDAVPVLDLTSYDAAQRRAVRAAIERGDFVVRREMPLPDMHVALHLLDRTSPPALRVSCP